MLNTTLEEAPIVNILHKMQTPSANEAQSQLLSLSSDPSFLSCLHAILRSTDQQWVKTVAACSLNRIFIFWLSSHSPLQLSQSLMNILSDPTIKPLNKRCLQRSITQILNQCDDTLRIAPPIIVYRWLGVVSNMLTSDPDTAYLLMSCMAVGDKQEAFKLTLVKKTFLPTIQQTTVSVPHANTLNEFYKMWIVIFNALQILQNNTQCMRMITNSTQLTTLIINTMQLEANDHLYITTTLDLSQLNFLKHQALSLLKHIINYCLEHPYTSNHPLTTLTHSIIPITRSLYFLAANKTTISQLLCDDLIITLTSLQILFIRHTPISIEECKLILNNIILPLLQRDQEEIASFDEDPSLFLSLTEDCCDHQTMGTLKTQLCQLLETIVKKHQEIGYYALHTAVQSIKVKLGFVAAESNHPISVDISLLILGICAYKLADYNKLCEDLKVIFCDERINQMAEHEQARMFAVLGYFYCDMFPQKTDGAHLFTYALNKYNAHPTIFLCALDFVEDIIEDVFNIDVLLLLLNTFKDDNKNQGMYYNIYHKVITHHYKIIPNKLILSLIEIIFIKVKMQFQRIFNKEQESTLQIINHFQILQSILQQSPPQNITQSIYSITQFWPQSVVLQLDDALVSILTQYAKCTHDPQLLSFLPTILTHFSRHHYIQTSYFLLLNTLIIRWPLTCLQPILLTLQTILCSSLLQKKKVTTKALATTLLLLQHHLAVHTPHDTTQLSSIAYRFLHSTPPHKPIILARAFNLLYLSHLLQPIDTIQQELKHILPHNPYLNTQPNSHDTNVITMCLHKDITRIQDPLTIALLLTHLTTIITQSDHTIPHKHSHKINKSYNTLEEINNITNKMQTPFNKRAKDVVKESIDTLKKGNMYHVIVDALSEETKASIKNILSTKENRVIRKVVGIRDVVMEEEQDTAVKRNKMRKKVKKMVEQQ